MNSILDGFSLTAAMTNIDIPTYPQQPSPTVFFIVHPLYHASQLRIMNQSSAPKVTANFESLFCAHEILNDITQSLYRFKYHISGKAIGSNHVGFSR